MKPPQLGDLVRDLITGFEGIVVSTTAYLQGCDRLGVQSNKLHDGKPGDWVYFDVMQVEVVSEGVLPQSRFASPTQPTVTGGPRPDAPQR